MISINYNPGIDPDVDYYKVPPINHKRSLAFINGFVMRTVSFLNAFSRSCDSRFLQFENKLQKVEAALLILESKLASIPDLIPETSDNTTNIETFEQNVEDDNLANLPDIAFDDVDNNEESGTQGVVNGICVKDDVRYSKFFKMLQVGVPEPAVKLKMQSEGLDPNILNEPMKVIEIETRADNET